MVSPTNVPETHCVAVKLEGKRGGREAHIERVKAGDVLVGLDGIDGAREQLPCPVLKREHLARHQTLQQVLQRPAVRSQEEELAPESLGLLAFMFVLETFILVEMRTNVSAGVFFPGRGYTSR